MKLTAILWDMDGTLLNFLAAEKAAIRDCFRRFELGEITDEQIARYSKINIRYWERLERGEITKPEVLIGRFHEFFEAMHLNPEVAEPFNEVYQVSLGDTVVYCDDSLNLVKSLAGRVHQYIVSNGTIVAQTKKLKTSGFGEIVDGVFLSEQVGFEKPAKSFFDCVFAEIPDSPENCMIVGDSLTSDIQGGINAGIRTCWYNPAGKPNARGIHPDIEIKNLHEILNLL